VVVQDGVFALFFDYVYYFFYAFFVFVYGSFDVGVGGFDDAVGFGEFSVAGFFELFLELAFVVEFDFAHVDPKQRHGEG